MIMCEKMNTRYTPRPIANEATYAYARAAVCPSNLAVIDSNTRKLLFQEIWIPSAMTPSMHVATRRATVIDGLSPKLLNGEVSLTERQVWRPTGAGVNVMWSMESKNITRCGNFAGSFASRRAKCNRMLWQSLLGRRSQLWH